ncbi:hypothetical protein [Streptomyces sp. NPDC057438]|uniref:hypothetical protein n=1 Tax=Streptomyces sp. NPDC057438 TaxID=3346133 RepID=UPI0036B666CE
MAGGEEAGAQAARARALAVLRVRSRALAVAVLPAAVAVVLLVGGATGRLTGPGWSLASRVVSGLALVVLLAAAGIALVVARARPAVSPTVAVAEEAAPDLYRLVRDLADRLDVPPPSAIALTPDCDSWLEDRTHSSHRPPAGPRRSSTDGAEGAEGSDTVDVVGGGAAAGGGRGGQRADEMADARGSSSGLPSHRRHRPPTAPVLVIGSPFLWWMRVGELRAVLAPVVAGTGPSAHPDIASARRFVRGLDAAVAVASAPSRGAPARTALAGVGWVTRLLLRGCRGHAAEMERGVAAAAAERAQAVDYGLRIVAQEQVGLAYAGWDRLLTRVALPAWRMGRWPSRLDAGVVAALTELSRRDRLAEGFASRLGERPACDLLEEPGTVDEAASLLAARLFHGGPAASGPDWSPVDWHEYPDEVVDRKWRTDAARLHRVLDALGARHPASDPTTDPTGPAPGGPTLSRVLTHLTTLTADGPHPSATGTPDPGAAPTTTTPYDRPSPHPVTGHAPHPGPAGPEGDSEAAVRRSQPEPTPDEAPHPEPPGHASNPGAAGRDPLAALTAEDELLPRAPAPHDREHEHNPGLEPDSLHISPPHTGTGPDARPDQDPDPDPDLDPDDEPGLANARSAALAAALTAELAREEAAVPAGGHAGAVEAPGPDRALWDDGLLPLFPMQPPRTGRELLTEHVAAMVCCAAMDTAGATPGLDWLDGPSLLVDGVRAADLAPRVLTLVEDGDPAPLRDWLRRLGVRPEKPVRLV